jgi:hypothetical protein
MAKYNLSLKVDLNIITLCCLPIGGVNYDS